jgi:LacI family transcriptional regulator
VSEHKLTSGGADGRARPVTLADIARAAGTSPSTASRALSGRGYVSAAARQRLRDAADRLGYVPNASARALKQRTSRVIGVAVSDLRNPFYAQLAAGIEQTLRAADYQVVVISDNSASDEELAAARTFLALRAPGVIMTPVGRDAASLLARHGTVVVEVDRRLAGEPCDAVVLDNIGGGRDAVQHLFQLGHRRVGLLVVDTEWTTDVGRLTGYLRAHEEARVAVDADLIRRVAPDDEGPEREIESLLDGAAPTAIFAANNVLAERAWSLLRARRLRLPRDVSLVAFDDVAWMGMVEPGVTAVAQPTVEMGRRAAKLLLRRVENRDGAPSIELLKPWLVVRGSTGPPRP